MTLLQLVVKADMFALSLYEGFSVPFSIPAKETAGHNKDNKRIALFIGILQSWI